MSRLRSPVFRLESLEDRSVPAVFGQPWLDGRHITLSFAADGTLISGVASSLTTALAPVGVDAGKKEILRAFQAWARNGNLNVGLVADSNSAFGTAGALQGDPRFGDIRIGARPMSSDVLAITAPPTLLSPSAGDLILNAARPFAFGNQDGKYDLFTVALQESGHTFGLGNSVDPISVMYEQYGSARTGLSAGDIADVRALYGARAGDAYEGSTGNDSIDAATMYTGQLEADLTTTTDVDVYKYTANAPGPRWFRVNAAGLSLVTPRLDVLNSAGEVIGTAAAEDLLHNNVTVYVEQVQTGETYYLRVSAAHADEFGVGGYRVAVDDTADGSAGPDPYALVDTEIDANNAAATAVEVTRSSGPFNYAFRSSLSAATDVDYFRLRTPDSSTSTLNLTVSGVGKTWFAPRVSVYSTAGTLLATKVVTQTDSSVALSLGGVVAGTEYLVRVASGNGSTGNYDVVADFQTAGLPKMMGAKGSLDSGHSSTSATLTVWQTQTVQINLLATTQDGADTVGLLRIYDSQNRLVFELYSQTGSMSTGHAYLRRGLYRVEVRTLDGSPVDFAMTMWGVSDPIGATPTDPTGDPNDSGDVLPPPPDSSTTTAIAPPLFAPPTVVWF